MVTEHFGHCEGFMIFEKTIKLSKVKPANPDTRFFLADPVNVISGGMGGGAVEIFNERNVEGCCRGFGDQNC